MKSPFRSANLIEPPTPSFWQQFKTTTLYAFLLKIPSILSNFLTAQNVLLSFLFTALGGILIALCWLIASLTREPAQCRAHAPTNAASWLHRVYPTKTVHIEHRSDSAFDLVFPNEPILSISCDCTPNGHCGVSQ